MIDAKSANALVDAVISASPTTSAPQQVSGVVQGKDADGTIWVLLDGATEPTPARSTTVAVSPGDAVTATVGNGRVAIDGNRSRPATDDAKAIEANDAAKDADKAAQQAMATATAAAADATLALGGIASAESNAAAAISASSAARIAADQAASMAAATGQHFWHNADGASTHGGAGVHVTDETQEDWDAAVAAGFPDLSTQKPYHNILINSLGILLRSALKNLVSITRSAIAFFDGVGNDAANVVASFGSSGAQIGKTTDSHVMLDYHSLQLVDKNGTTYFHVSDMRDQNGNVEVKERMRYSSASLQYKISFAPIDNTYVNVFWLDSAIVHATKTRVTGWTRDGKTITLESALPSDAKYLEVDYTTASSIDAYTLGNRSTDSGVGPFSAAIGRNIAAYGYASIGEGYGTTTIGAYSHAEGLNTIASGDFSHVEGTNSEAAREGCHAEGSGTLAVGLYSHAEGNGSESTGQAAHAEGYSTASGDWSHAEGHSTTASGSYSHAEGYGTTASSGESHAEGYQSVASGPYSHAQNKGTKATTDSATAIGRYNDPGSYAFTIGNGTSDSARSNAVAVDWSGNVEASGNIEASGNVEATGLISGSGGMQLNGTVDMRGQSTIDRDAPAPASDTMTRRMVWNDKDGERIGEIRVNMMANGDSQLMLGSVAEGSDGTEYAHWLRINQSRSGSRSISMTDAAAWRSALSIAKVKSTATSQITMASSGDFTLSNIATNIAAGLVLTVQIVFTNTVALTNGTTYSIGVLAAGLRPYNRLFNASTGHASDEAWINTGGTVQYRPRRAVSANTTLYISATYVTD